jgi:hypothetical protein
MLLTWEVSGTYCSLPPRWEIAFVQGAGASLRLHRDRLRGRTAARLRPEEATLRVIELQNELIEHNLKMGLFVPRESEEG